MSARHQHRATQASLDAIAQCRRVLAPGFAAYWNGRLGPRDRRWFIECAGLPARKETAWDRLSADEQTKVREAWAAFMTTETPHTSNHYPA